jgi:hypothetical protein
MENRNSYSREGFIKELGHVRKIELANLIMDNASVDEMNEAGFSKISIQEMATQIKKNVVGYGDLKIEFSMTEEEKEERAAKIAAANTEAEKKSEDDNQVFVPDQTAGNEETIPEVDSNAPGTDPNYDETLGGNKTEHDSAENIIEEDNQPKG